MIKWLYFIASAIMILASTILCQQIISNSISNQINKNDYAQINNIKYGLFNIREWKNQIHEILVEEINKMHLSPANERQLKIQIESLLNTLIDKVYIQVKKSNTGTVGGWLKQSFINTFVDLDDIKKGIPGYADAILSEITKAKTQTQIKVMLNHQLSKYLKQTFDRQDTSRLDRIIARTNSSNVQEAKIRLNEMISYKHKLIFWESFFLILLSVTLFVISGIKKQPLTQSQYFFLILSLLILLVAGVTTPMIDMEMKISKMSFVLLGHPVTFTDQVLYFQSKSILDVFWLMVTHKDIQLKIIGILMITFSVVFPVLKVISTMLYHLDFHKAKSNPVINFFVFKSGKWSMADVMVIAIFMSYIGFNGIISSQFRQFDRISALHKDMILLTTNGTTLQPGYYLFMTYTLLALFLSGFVLREQKKLRRWKNINRYFRKKNYDQALQDNTLTPQI